MFAYECTFKLALSFEIAEFADMAGIVDFRIIGSDPACIINALCDLYDGISVEAKTIKEYWLKPKIRNMIEQGVSLLTKGIFQYCFYFQSIFLSHFCIYFFLV